MINCPDCGCCQLGAPYEGPYDIDRQCRLCYLAATEPEALPSLVAKPKEVAVRPGLLQKAGNFTLAIGKDALSGFKRVPEAVHAERRAICDSCPYLDAVKDKCTKCGCPLERGLLKKLWMATSRCGDKEAPRWLEYKEGL